jgi:hypothetical protein
MAFSGCSASIAVKVSIFDWTIGLSSIAWTQLIRFFLFGFRFIGWYQPRAIGKTSHMCRSRAHDSGLLLNKQVLVLQQVHRLLPFNGSLLLK